LAGQLQEGVTAVQQYKQVQHSVRQWLEDLLVAVSGVSVSTKILGIVLALSIALGLGVTLQVRGVMTTTLLAELDNRGHSVVSDLAGRSARLLEAQQYTELTALLTETVHNHPDTRYAFVVDGSGQVLGHTFDHQVPADLLALTPTMPPTREYHIHYENYEGEIHDFTEPIVGANGAFIR
jgi:hypothetical protein